MAEIDNSWYAVYTMPRAEKKVFSRLELVGYNVYLPLTSSIRVWSDRKKKVTVPLISSYVFVKCKENVLRDVFKIPGVCGVLKYLNKPAIIKDSEIDLLKFLMSDAEKVTVLEDFQYISGEEVIILKGPFKGLKAQFIDLQSKYRILVNVEGLGVSLEINLPISFIQKSSI